MTRKQGQLAEQTAAHFLQEKGLQLIQTNFQCYWGELDLIMQDDQQLVFVEVRQRGQNAYGNALESITIPKQKRLIRTALYFLQQKKCLNSISSRFDVIAIHSAQGKMQLEWIKNALLLNG